MQIDPKAFDKVHPVAEWLSGYCQIGPHFEGKIGALYAAWETWDAAHAEINWSKKRFSSHLCSWGFGRRRGTGGTHLHVGLRLNPE